MDILFKINKPFKDYLVLNYIGSMNEDQMNELARRKAEINVKLEHEMIFPHLCLKGVTSETLEEHIEILNETVTKLKALKWEMLSRCHGEDAIAKLRDFINVDLDYEDSDLCKRTSLKHMFIKYLALTEAKTIQRLNGEREKLRQSFWYDDFDLFESLRFKTGLSSGILKRYNDLLNDLFLKILNNDMAHELRTELKWTRTIWDYLDEDETLKKSFMRKLKKHGINIRFS